MRAIILTSMFLITTTATEPQAAAYLLHPDGTGDFPTIQAAINAVVDGDVIELADGVYQGPGNRDLTLLGKEITIRSQSGNAETCVIDCQASSSNRHRGFRVDAGEGAGTLIRGITIENGYAPFDNPGDWGGGILCLYASPTVEDCIFRNNRAGWGGGILLWGSAARISRCQVFDNEATQNGGGVYVTTDSPAFLEYVTIVFNRTLGDGGALVCNAASPVINNCTMAANEGNSGSAVWTINDAFPTLRACIIAANTETAAFECRNGAGAALACCDLYGNDEGNWVSCIAAQIGVAGNIELDPLFCQDGFGLRDDSPCAPFTPPNEECGLIGAQPVACEVASVPEAIGDPWSGAGTRVVPNPTAGRADIVFALEAPAVVEVTIVDIVGRVVRRLVDGVELTGSQRIEWDGRDERGQALPSGSYLARIRAGNHFATRRVVLSK